MPKQQLQVVERFKEAIVTVQSGGQKKRIVLADATKQELQLLYDKGHPGVEEKPGKDTGDDTAK